jgi:hypothetical protein
MKSLRRFSPAGKRLALHIAAILILVAGFTAAFIIWPAHPIDENAKQMANPAMPLAPSDSTKQSRQIEIYYGKTGVLFERWSEDIAALAQGKLLAEAIAFCSALLTLTCAFAASRIRD